MCGIVGGLTNRNIGPILLEGLARLEYRGYDSAGLAIINDDKTLSLKRVIGKVAELNKAYLLEPMNGYCGIAHTRWATHGEPSESNAHPHISCNEIAVVHNGIIENYEKLRDFLQAEGYIFSSETDSEVIAHLIHYHFKTAADLLIAVQRSLKELVGMYAIGVISIKEPDCLIAARSGSPLVIGLGEGENFIASDSLALLALTHRFIYLEEGDIAKINGEVQIYNKKDMKVKRKETFSNLSAMLIDRGKFPHYMKKEIFEQGDCAADMLAGRLSGNKILTAIFGVNAQQQFSEIENVTLIACGTSYYAALVARYWLEEIAGISAQVDVASEYRYRHPVIKPHSLFVAISQSGETADTLAAFRQAKKQGYTCTLAICNVPESSLVREADLVLLTRAGPEICVASTKSFTTQLIALLMLTVVLGKYHRLSNQEEQEIVCGLYNLPAKIQSVLDGLNDRIENLARRFVQKENAIFLGRGSLYPVALEGALKMKEITYIHAEGYPAGELKHGPLAIVDQDMPVFVVAPDNDLFEKLKSNLQEVKARKGELIIFAHEQNEINKSLNVEIIKMPSIEWMFAPVIYAIPLQLLAYHLGVLRGTNVDQPRNLAKSVTVE